MRWRFLCGGVLVLVASCAQRSAARTAGDGELVLELGGAGRSLAGSLQKLGVELLPAPEPLPAPSPGNDAKPSPSPSTERGPAIADETREDAPAPDPLAPKTDAPNSVAEGETFEVVLGPNETLMDVSSKHLGTAKRFKELMTLNGFSERDTRRLKPGQKIKVPKTVKPQSSR